MPCSVQLHLPVFTAIPYAPVTEEPVDFRTVDCTAPCSTALILQVTLNSTLSLVRVILMCRQTNFCFWAAAFHSTRLRCMFCFVRVCEMIIPLFLTKYPSSKGQEIRKDSLLCSQDKKIQCFPLDKEVCGTLSLF